MTSKYATFKVGDRVVYQSNPYNRQAVRTGQVKRINNETGEVKYLVKDMSSGAEALKAPQEIVRRM